MSIVQKRLSIKKYIDIADAETIERIYQFIEMEKEADCIDFLTKDQLVALDNAIVEADANNGEPSDKVIKKMKRKWLVK